MSRPGRIRDSAIVQTATPLAAISSGEAASAPLSLTLNLPAYRLEVRRGSELVRTYSVAVGMPKYPTPRGAFAVTEIEWNPWWIPPDREWARHEHVTSPGSDNPMGKVKLYFGPLYFLHGTPLVSSIGHAASHGCVRLRNEDAIELARLIQEGDDDAVAGTTLDSLLVDYTRTRKFELTQPVRLLIRYRVAEVRSDSLFLYPDIYHLGAATVDSALAAMAATGLDTTAVRADVLTRAARASHRTTVAMSLDSITAR